MEKLKNILDLHGVIYIINDGKFDCYCYSCDKIFDTLEVIGGKLYINGKIGNIFDWLGY